MENVTYGKFYLWQTYYGKCKLQNVTDTCLGSVVAISSHPQSIKKTDMSDSQHYPLNIYHINDEGYHNGSNLKSIKF